MRQRQLRYPKNTSEQQTQTQLATFEQLHLQPENQVDFRERTKAANQGCGNLAGSRAKSEEKGASTCGC